MELVQFAFLFFFGTVIFKVVVDTYKFWFEDEAKAVTVTPQMSPKHIPAPSRPSPKNPNFRTTPAPRKQAASTVIRPIKKHPAAAKAPARRAA